MTKFLLRKKGAERIPPKYKTPYNDICLFEGPGDILLFNKRCYKVSISVGLVANKIYPVNSVFT